MFRFVLYIFISCFLVADASLSVPLTPDEWQRVNGVYSQWALDMQDEKLKETHGTIVLEEGKPHLHDPNLLRGIGLSGEAPSGGDFCALFDKRFGYKTSKESFEAILGKCRTTVGQKPFLTTGKASQMLTHPDASNPISQALLPRLHWLDTTQRHGALNTALKALEDSSGTPSACYNAFFIVLLANLKASAASQEEEDLQMALELSRSSAGAAAAPRGPKVTPPLSEAKKKSIGEILAASHLLPNDKEEAFKALGTTKSDVAQFKTLQSGAAAAEPAGEPYVDVEEEQNEFLRELGILK